MIDTTNVFRAGLFEGRTALVTGGGSGIGFAIAEYLGELGARLVLMGRTPERLDDAVARLGQAGITALARPGNIRDEGEVAAVFAGLEADGALPDILVNNAGGQFSAEALDISANGFRSVTDLNLNGTWHMTSAFGQMAKRLGRGGSVVNIVLAAARGLPGYVHGAAARAGVINMTMTLAIEWAPLGIRINCIAPGSVDTEALAQYGADAPSRWAKHIPLQRLGEPREVAAAVAFLAGPAGDYITGVTLPLDGGSDIRRAQG